MEENNSNQSTGLLLNRGYSLDPEIGEAMAAFTAKYPQGPPPEKEDWQALRVTLNKFYTNLSDNFPVYPDVNIQDFTIDTGVGTKVKLRWYNPSAEVASRSAVVYLHGGGRLSGSLELYGRIVSHFAHLSGVPFLSVDYNLSPEVQGNMQAEEAFSALTWLKEHAADMGIDVERIAIMGDSAGGGIAAGAAILARDRNVHLSCQILIYPMLDDRVTVADQRLVPFAVWTYDNNHTGWTASLGSDQGSNAVPAVAAPGRLLEFEGLAPAFISVGDLDIFRDENLDYAVKLAKAGVPVELHIYPGVPHGFEFIAPHAAVSRRAMADYIRIVQSV